MKTLHLVKTSIGAGWAVRQIQQLVLQGEEVHVVLPEGGPRVAEYEAAGATVHLLQPSLPLTAPWQIPATFRRIRDLVDEVQPDLIHSYFVATTLAARLALGRHHPTPRLFQVPGPLHLEHASTRRAELASAGRSDYWMGTCEWTRQRYLSLGLPSDRVFMTYLGLDLDRFVPQAPGRLRAELNLAPETPVIGMVSYFYAPKRMLGQRRGLKGHEDLIDALELVFAHEPNAAAVFVGGAWANANAYEERVKAYARAKLGSRVHFLGTRNDVQQLYADIDLAVHPSHSENVGGAAESMLLGVPTIATDVGGFPDIVKPGRTGWLVPPRDPRALAGAIDEALADPDQTARMAENGRVLAREVLDRRRNVQELLSAYESIVHGQGRIAA